MTKTLSYDVFSPKNQGGDDGDLEQQASAAAEAEFDPAAMPFAGGDAAAAAKALADARFPPGTKAKERCAAAHKDFGELPLPGIVHRICEGWDNRLNATKRYGFVRCPQLHEYLGAEDLYFKVGRFFCCKTTLHCYIDGFCAIGVQSGRSFHV